MLVLAASRSAGGSLAVLIPLAVIAAILLAIPRAVILDEAGIMQRRLLFANRQTAWPEVATVARDARTGRTFVWSNERRIAAVFSPVMGGHHRFVQEIRARAKNVVFETK